MTTFRTPLVAFLALGACMNRKVDIVSGEASMTAPAPVVSGDHAGAIRDSLVRILDRAVRDSAFPGAFAIVGTHDRVLAQYGAGHIDWAPSPVPDEHTIWDLASLTKVIGTTSAAMQLVEQGKLDLDAPVQRYLPEWRGTNQERVTIRHLLTHSSGLPPFRNLPMDISADSTRKLLWQIGLDSMPGQRLAYSDIGAFILGQAIERVSGETLDGYLARHVFGPLGLHDTMFNPPKSLLARIAPTETEDFRGGQVRGEVHDERAWKLGGVAPHAGLFSSGHDLAQMAQLYLNHGTLHGVRIWSPATVDRFMQYVDSTFSNRALGWQKPERPGMKYVGPSAAWAGHRASSRAIGHTGFTGTSILIDPQYDIFVVLLTNRVNPTRNNNKITGVRAAVTDAVLSVLGAPTTPPRT